MYEYYFYLYFSARGREVSTEVRGFFRHNQSALSMRTRNNAVNPYKTNKRAGHNPTRLFIADTCLLLLFKRYGNACNKEYSYKNQQEYDEINQAYQ